MKVHVRSMVQRLQFNCGGWECCGFQASDEDKTVLCILYDSRVWRPASAGSCVYAVATHICCKLACPNFCFCCVRTYCWSVVPCHTELQWPERCSSLLSGSTALH